MSDAVRTVPTLDNLRTRRQAVLMLMAQYGVSNVRVFGSVARGEATPESDIDFLVDLPEHFSLLDLSGLVGDLRALLGHPVQVASAAHLREEMAPYILKDVQSL